MHFKLSVCVFVIFASLLNARNIREKRQDWNFPGAVDNSNSNVGESSNPRPPSTSRPAATNAPSTTRRPTGSDGTLPPVGIVVFSAPCGRCMTTPQYNPVCGDDSRTYANRGILDCVRTCGFNVEFQRLGVCQTPR